MVDLEALRDYEAARELLNAEMRYYGIDFEFSEEQAAAVVDIALPEADAPVVWRCWENIILGGPPTDADWTPHLERPSYCRPENGHKDCGRMALVRIGDEL